MRWMLTFMSTFGKQDVLGFNLCPRVIENFRFFKDFKLVVVEVGLRVDKVRHLC